ISTDSAYNYPYAQTPSFMHKGGYMYTTIKVLNVFPVEDQADSAVRADLKINGRAAYDHQLVDFEKKIKADSIQISADSKTISDWLDKHQQQYIRGKWGAFVVIHNEGNGEPIKYDDVVALNYTEKILDSTKIVDSSTDPQFQHEGTFEVTMRKLGSVIPGWTDALMQLKKGAKATVYLPSSLAFGKQGKPGKIPPNAIIVFDVDIVNVISEDQALQIVSENRKRAEASEKKQN
ncbi:MAG TPA: FKBP-type peptidyl-prolyl cis-trans isomerase, partial [Ferruginibacter sp.]|nr:FKBP-type peptidyl-prolyl cis-trans isomerase [Ferruginibacter sp.]